MQDFCGTPPKKKFSWVLKPRGGGVAVNDFLGLKVTLTQNLIIAYNNLYSLYHAEAFLY